MDILVDCDGVLSDFEGRVYECLQDRGYDVEGARQAVRSTALRYVLEAACVPHAIYKEVVEAPGFVSGMPVLSDALLPMQRLRDLGEVWVVTSPWYTSPSWVAERYEWVRQYFGIHPKRVVIASDKHLLGGDVFIEDSVKQADAWVVYNWPRSNGQCLGFLLDRAGTAGHTVAHRVRSWDAIVAAIESRLEAPICQVCLDE